MTALRQLKCFYSSQVNVIVKQFNFRWRAQHDGKSTRDYVAELRRLANKCQFGALAEEMTCDQVVEKAVHTRLRERFLQNNAVTLENVLNQVEAY